MIMSFITYFTNYYENDEIKIDEMGGTCNCMKERRIRIKYWQEILRYSGNPEI
jgi:hypothetical protein